MDLLSEAYGRIGGIHMSDLAQQAAGHLASEDGEDHDKTGHLNDRDLLDKVKRMGTAGDRLIDAAEERLKEDPEKGLTPPERDALARDAYGDAEKKIARDHEDNEKIWPQEDRYEQDLDKDAERRGWKGPGDVAH